MENSSIQRQFQKLVEIEKELQHVSSQTSEKLNEYTTAKKNTSIPFSSILASFGTTLQNKVSILQEKFGMIANAKEFIKNNYTSLIILVVTIFLASCSSLIFFVFSNLKNIINTFTQILKYTFNYTLDFGTSVKIIIYDKLVSIIIQRLTQECCINSSSSSSNADQEVTNMVKVLRRISRHSEKVNTGNVDTTCKAIFALTKPFSTIMTTVKSSYEYIYTSFIDILMKLMSYLSKKNVTTVDPNDIETFKNGSLPSETSPPQELKNKQQFYPEIHIRRQLYLQSCQENNGRLRGKFIKKATYTLAALFILVMFVPGISKILMVAKFLSKTFLISNLISLLQNGKVLAYIAGLQVFVALYLCCIYKRQPTIANTKLITQKLVRNKILRCSPTSSGKGFMESMAPLINFKNVLLRKSLVYASNIYTGRKNMQNEDYGNILLYLKTKFHSVVKEIQKVCSEENIVYIFTLIHQLSVATDPYSILRVLTKKIEKLIFYFSGTSSVDKDPSTTCKEKIEYKRSILGCVLFSYFETYKHLSETEKHPSMEKNRKLGLDAIKNTLEEIKESFTLYDETDATKVTDTISEKEIQLCDEVEKEVTTFFSEERKEDLDRFCNHLQLDVLLHDKLDEALRSKKKSLENFVEIVLQKYSVELFQETSAIQEPSDRFYELGETILSSWGESAESSSKNVLVKEMNQLLYEERVQEENATELFTRRLMSCEAYEKVVFAVVDIFKHADDSKFSNNDVLKKFTVENTKKVLFAKGRFYVELKYYYISTSASVTYSCDFSKVYHTNDATQSLEKVIVDTTPFQLTLHTKQPSNSLVSSILKATTATTTTTYEPQVVPEKHIVFTLAKYQQQEISLALLSFETLQEEFRAYLKNPFVITLKNIRDPPTPQQYNTSWLTSFDSSKLANYFLLDPVTRFGIYHNEAFFSGSTSKLFYFDEKTFEHFRENSLDRSESVVGANNYHNFQDIIQEVDEFQVSGGSARRRRKHTKRRLGRTVYKSSKRDRHSSLLPIL
jgi:hypothetical protein